MTTRKKKISAELPVDDFELLQKLAEDQHISMTDALRRALRLSDWIREIKKARKQLIVRDDRAGTEQQALLID